MPPADQQAYSGGRRERRPFVKTYSGENQETIQRKQPVVRHGAGNAGIFQVVTPENNTQQHGRHNAFGKVDQQHAAQKPQTQKCHQQTAQLIAA